MRRALALLLVMTVAVAAGCGDDEGSSSAGSAAPGGTLNVFAAASLTDSFTELADTYEQAHEGWTVRLNFQGSDALAAQIDQGVDADVYAAASPKYPDELKADDLLGETTDFATNKLVLITPPDNPAAIESPEDLKDGAKLVVGDPEVPVGAYTETVLENLGIDQADLNIVSKEQDVKAVVAKVKLGEADAGFVYVTDALADQDSVKEFELPDAAQATAVYPIGIVSASSQEDAAQQWIDLVMSSEGQDVLAEYGFGPPPSS